MSSIVLIKPVVMYVGETQACSFFSLFSRRFILSEQLRQSFLFLLYLHFPLQARLGDNKRRGFEDKKNVLMVFKLLLLPLTPHDGLMLSIALMKMVVRYMGVTQACSFFSLFSRRFILSEQLRQSFLFLLHLHFPLQVCLGDNKRRDFEDKKNVFMVFNRLLQPLIPQNRLMSSIVLMKTVATRVGETQVCSYACQIPADRKSTRLNSSHQCLSRMPSSA